MFFFTRTGAVEALTAALVEYTGTMVIVTHNRDFCEKIKATHVAMVRGDGSVSIDSREVWGLGFRLEGLGVSLECVLTFKSASIDCRGVWGVRV